MATNTTLSRHGRVSSSVVREPAHDVLRRANAIAAHDGSGRARSSSATTASSSPLGHSISHTHRHVRTERTQRPAQQYHDRPPALTASARARRSSDPTYVTADGARAQRLQELGIDQDRRTALWLKSARGSVRSILATGTSMRSSSWISTPRRRRPWRSHRAMPGFAGVAAILFESAVEGEAREVDDRAGGARRSIDAPGGATVHRRVRPQHEVDSEHAARRRDRLVIVGDRRGDPGGLLADRRAFGPTTLATAAPRRASDAPVASLLKVTRPQ